MSEHPCVHQLIRPPPPWAGTEVAGASFPMVFLRFSA